MLEKESRKELKEQNWLQISAKSSNPSQKLKRYRQQGIDAIVDLKLFAERLPEDALCDIFSYANVRTLVNALLSQEKNADLSSLSRSTQIAALIVEQGIDYCLSRYKQRHSNTPLLNKPAIDQLNNAIHQCKEIAFEEDNAYRISVSYMGMDYLFNWDKIPGPDEPKIIQFLRNEFDAFIRVENNNIHVEKPTDDLVTVWIEVNDSVGRGYALLMTKDKTKAKLEALEVNIGYDDESDSRIKFNSVIPTPELPYLQLIREYDNIYVYKSKTWN